jgi:CHAT domain-containing protein/Tfp pilus assembly protein PilF
MFSVIAAFAIAGMTTSAVAGSLPESEPATLAAIAPLRVKAKDEPLEISQVRRITQIDPAIADPATDIIENEIIENEISQLLEIAAEQSLAQADEAALESYLQALSLIERLDSIDPLVQGEVLWGLGSSYQYLEKDNEALPILEEALTLYNKLAEEQTAQDRPEANSDLSYADIRIDLYSRLGGIQYNKAHYATALRYYQLGLALAETYTDKSHQAGFQHNIGLVQTGLGLYSQAEEALKQSIALSEEPELMASAIFILGQVFERQENYSEAIARYQEAIALYEIIKTTDSETRSEDFQDTVSRQARALNNLGMVYLKQGNQIAAQEFFARGLTLLTVQEDAPEPEIWLLERAILINSLGELYQAKGDRTQAWQSYLQAFQIAKQTADKVGEIEALLNFGRLMEAQGQPNLAIFFYKQAIARIETIREDLKSLSESVQQRYTQTVEDFYRKLADLLLQQNRQAEALQVLELLKLQEVRSYLQAEPTAQTEPTLGAEKTFNTPAEAALLEAFDTLPIETSLADFLASAEAIAVRDRPHNPPSDSSDSTSDSSNAQALPFSIEAVESLKLALAAQPLKTAVLYPLILENHLEIILLTPDGTVRHLREPISQADLRKTVEDFQKGLKEKGEVEPAAQKLYSAIIQPLEETLSTEQIKNIIYLPDSFLRYVPLAAFHDGNQWLAEKYQSHNITAASIDDLAKTNTLPRSVVAGAFTDHSLSYSVSAGPKTWQYSGLRSAQQEIDNLVNAIPGTTTFLNQDFSKAGLLNAVGDRQIVHLATHANFLPGQPEESFILFGDGDTVDMRELQEWQLPNVDLVVLSACETASSVEGDGKEILGLGFQIRKTGAGAAIASLWSVDDRSTAALMSQFYQALSQGQTKTQALQYAQQQLIASEHYNHPYDWSAFILIGNGL